MEGKMRAIQLFTLILAVTGAFTLAACAGFPGSPASVSVRSSGNEITESRDVSGFSAINLSGFGELNIAQTGTESLSIKADENFMPYLKTEVRDNTLYIGVIENTNFRSIPDITYTVTVDDLESLEVSGAGSIHVNDLDTSNLEVRVPGAGSIVVDGRVTTQNIDLSGAGSYDGSNLASENATIFSSGAGTATVQVSDDLDVTINGLGSVEYIGNPRVTQDINGLGTVQQRQ
jgi:hypothetical protein